MDRDQPRRRRHAIAHRQVPIGFRDIDDGPAGQRRQPLAGRAEKLPFPRRALGETPGVRREYRRDVAHPGAQPAQDTGLRGMRVNQVRAGLAQQRENLSQRQRIFRRCNRLDQARKYVADYAHLPGFVQQKAVLAGGYLHLAAILESTNEIQQMDLRATSLGARDQIENLHLVFKGAT